MVIHSLFDEIHAQWSTFTGFTSSRYFRPRAHDLPEGGLLGYNTYTFYNFVELQPAPPSAAFPLLHRFYYDFNFDLVFDPDNRSTVLPVDNDDTRWKQIEYTTADLISTVLNFFYTTYVIPPVMPGELFTIDLIEVNPASTPLVLASQRCLLRFKLRFGLQAFF